MICGSELLVLFDKLSNVGLNSKIAVYSALIKQEPVAKLILEYASDPFKSFYMTSLESFPAQGEHCDWNALFPALDILTKKRSADFRDKQVISNLAGTCPFCRELVSRILKQKLRVGVGAKSLIKAGCNISLAQVQLCERDPRSFTSKEEFFQGPKLNGVRLRFKRVNGVLNFLSRKGHIYPKLPELFEDLNISDNVDYDAEMLSTDGSHHASGVARTVNEFKEPIDNLRKKMSIHVFDIPSLAEESLAVRLSILHSDEIQFTNNYVYKVKHELCVARTDKEFFDQVWGYMDRAVAAGYEGSVIKNPYLEYYPDRSYDWVKLKPFDTVDLPVLYAITGTEGKTAGVLSALVCDFKGVEVRVGSGFDDQERIKYLQNPPKYIRVKHQSVTKDGSLEFPIFDGDRSDELNEV